MSGEAQPGLQFCVLVEDEADKPVVAESVEQAVEMLAARGAPVVESVAGKSAFGLRDARVLFALQGMPGVPGSAFEMLSPDVLSGQPSLPTHGAPPAPEAATGEASEAVQGDAPPSPAAVDTSTQAAPEAPASPPSSLEGGSEEGDGVAAHAPHSPEEPATASLCSLGSASAPLDQHQASGQQGDAPRTPSPDLTPSRQAAAAAATGGDGVQSAEGTPLNGHIVSIFPAPTVSRRPTKLPTPSQAGSAEEPGAALVVPATEPVQWHIPTANMATFCNVVHGQQATKKRLVDELALQLPSCTKVALRKTLTATAVQRKLPGGKVWLMRRSVLLALGLPVDVTPPAVLGDTGSVGPAPGADPPPPAAMPEPQAPAPAEPVDDRLPTWHTNAWQVVDSLRSEFGAGEGAPGLLAETDLAQQAISEARVAGADPLLRDVSLSRVAVLLGHGSSQSEEVLVGHVHASLRCPKLGDVFTQGQVKQAVHSALSLASVAVKLPKAGPLPSTAPVATVPVQLHLWKAQSRLLTLATAGDKVAQKRAQLVTSVFSAAAATLRAMSKVVVELCGVPAKVAQASAKITACMADVLSRQSAEQAKREHCATAVQEAVARVKEAKAKALAEVEEAAAKEAAKEAKKGVTAASKQLFSSFFQASPAKGKESKAKAEAEAIGVTAAAPPTTSTASGSALQPLVPSSEVAKQSEALDAEMARMGQLAAEQAAQESKKLLTEFVKKAAATRRAAARAWRRKRFRATQAQLESVLAGAPGRGTADDHRQPPSTIPAGSVDGEEPIPHAWAGGSAMADAGTHGAVKLPGDSLTLLVPAHFSKPKLLHFDGNRRPSFWGTWSRRDVVSSDQPMRPLIAPGACPATLQDGSPAYLLDPRLPSVMARVGPLGPRRPFAADTRLMEYTVDSDAEWESDDDVEGEDVNDSDGSEEEDEAPPLAAPQNPDRVAGYDYSEAFLCPETELEYEAGAQPEHDTAGPPSEPPMGGVKRGREGASPPLSPGKRQRNLEGLAATIAAASSADGAGVGSAGGRQALQFGVVHDVHAHASNGNKAAAVIAPLVKPMCMSVPAYAPPSAVVQYKQAPTGTTSSIRQFSFPNLAPERMWGVGRAVLQRVLRGESPQPPPPPSRVSEFPAEAEAEASLKDIMRSNPRPADKISKLWLDGPGSAFPGTTAASVQRKVMQLGSREKGHGKPWVIHGEAPPAPVPAPTPPPTQTPAQEVSKTKSAAVAPPPPGGKQADLSSMLAANPKSA